MRATDRRSSKRPIRDSTVTGEALTMARSTIAQFARKFVRVDLHYLDPASGKRVDEVRAGHPRDLGRTPLRQH
jgi:hypothetical protein